MADLKALFRRLLGGSKSEEDVEADDTLVVDKAADIEPLATSLEAAPSPPKFSSGTFLAGWMTDVGRVRGHNEDALFIFMGEQDASNAVPPFGLFMVSDGMGGHQAGEVASSLAVQTAAQHLLSQIYLPMLAGTDRGADQPSLNEVMRAAISQANKLVTQDIPGSGCTLTCGLILGKRLFLGHVGDSRAYLLRPDEDPKQLTHDHSLVSRLKEMGQLTEEEAAVHPQRNVLYRAIGQYELEVDASTYTLQSGDSLLFCSDGLWNMMSDADISDLIAQAPTPHAACVSLVDTANLAGGNDNITVVLVDIRYDDE